jgi:hypothetical protein
MALSSERKIAQPLQDGMSTLVSDNSHVIKVRFHDGEEHVIDLTPTAEDDRIRKFMEMDRPGEVDAETGEITIYKDDIDTAREVITEVIGSVVAKGKEELMSQKTPVARPKLART